MQLAKLKLLNEYFETDEKWLRFYSKFCVVDDKQAGEARFSLIHALIALYFLCQSPPEVKAKAICDLFVDYRIF